MCTRGPARKLAQMPLDVRCLLEAYFEPDKYYLSLIGTKVGSGRVEPGRGFQNTVSFGEPALRAGKTNTWPTW